MSINSSTNVKMMFANVREGEYDKVCDSGWVNISHPIRPGIIMQRLSCNICNSDLSKPDSKLDMVNFFVGDVNDDV